MKDKIVYWQWQSETPDDEQTLTQWTTVLRDMDFSNKSVKLAVWVKDAKVHFYAECDGKSGYQVFDINGYENNALESEYGRWASIQVEARDGATSPIFGKYTKTYTIQLINLSYQVSSLVALLLVPNLSLNPPYWLNYYYRYIPILFGLWYIHLGITYLITPTN